MKRIIEFELQDNSPKIETELDFKGEIIRADEEALQNEYDKGKNEGYNSGKLDGYADGWGIGYNDGYDSGHLIGNEEGYTKGYSQGDSAGYSRGYSEGAFPLSFISGYLYLFRNAVFPENYDFTFKINESIVEYGAQGLFWGANLRSIKLIGENPAHTVDFNSAFRETNALEAVDLSEFKYKVSKWSYAFLTASALKYIYGDLDFSECTEATHWITSALLLEEIRFVPGTIKISLPCYTNPKLSADTIESIIDGLADLTGSTAQNVSFHSSIIAKLTPEQLDRIAAKNWTYS